MESAGRLPAKEFWEKVLGNKPDDDEDEDDAGPNKGGLYSFEDIGIFGR